MFSSETTSTNHCERTYFWWVRTRAPHVWFIHLPNWNFHLHLTPFHGRAICAVCNFQHLRFGNSQSSNKFAGNPKIVSHPTSSQESQKQQTNVYIYIAHHLQDQWHIPISPQTEKTPFLDRYSFSMTCSTHISPSCLTTNHPPNTLQRHLSTVLLQDFSQLMNIGCTHI